jgi:hypothetical protein
MLQICSSLKPIIREGPHWGIGLEIRYHDELDFILKTSRISELKDVFLSQENKRQNIFMTMSIEESAESKKTMLIKTNNVEI